MIIRREDITRNTANREQKIQRAIENMLDCFAIFTTLRDTNGKIVDFLCEYINEIACKNYYIPRESYVGKTLFEFFPSHRDNGLFEEYCNVVETGKPLIREAIVYEGIFSRRYQSKTMDIRAAKMDDGFVLTWRETQKSKQYEEALVEKEKLLEHIRDDHRRIERLLEEQRRLNSTLQTFIDVMPAGVMVTDANGFIIVANPAARDILGVKSASKAWGDECEYTLHRVDGSLYELDELPFTHSINFGTIEKDVEILVRHQNGKEIIILTSSCPLCDGTKKIVGAVVAFRDITVRKMNEIKLRESEETIRVLFNAITEDIFFLDVNGEILTVNESGANRYNKKMDELIGQSIHDLLPPKRKKEVDRRIKEVIRKKKRASFEEKMGEIYLRNTMYPVFDSDKNITRIAAFSQDITERRRMEETIRENEERFRTAFESAAAGIAIVTLDGRFVRVNRSLCNIVGYTEAEMLSITFKEITHPDDLKIDASYTNRLLCGEIPYYHLEKRYIHKNGEIVWIILSRSITRDSHGKPLYFISQVQDITERKRTEQELIKAREEAEAARERAELLASTDYLTGLLNRRAFMERLSGELERARRKNLSLCLVLADVDLFKRVNDTYGHQIGDMVLQKFASCLLGRCRSYDMIGRYGGEEFIVCLPDTTCEQAGIVAERMRIAVQKLDICLPGSEEYIHITSSFGISSTQHINENNIDALIEQADSSMYKAKLQGRNKVCKACEFEMFKQ